MNPKHPELAPVTPPQQGRGSNMVLDGVSLENRVVRDLAAIVGRPLGQKLEQALFFSAEIVALTRGERAEVLAALDRMPWEFEEIRKLLLAGERWGGSRLALTHI